LKIQLQMYLTVLQFPQNYSEILAIHEDSKSANGCSVLKTTA